MPINIKTRPDGGDYQQLGVLHKENNVDLEFNKPGNNNDETVILSLFESLYTKDQHNGITMLQIKIIIKYLWFYRITIVLMKQMDVQK